MLPSQELTKKLIRYLAYEREDVVFVIMRSAAKWKELLDADVWEKMQSRLIVNKNMSQSLSENNLGKKELQYAHRTFEITEERVRGILGYFLKNSKCQNVVF